MVVKMEYSSSRLMKVGQYPTIAGRGQRPCSDWILGQAPVACRAEISTNGAKQAWQGHFVTLSAIRDAETANIPFMAALTGALRRCTSFVWIAKRHSARLALHPASTTKNRTSAISAP
jgi:hypothetical protein